MAPANTELELSVFGTGYGECVVAHVGNGDWIIVDSCTDGSGERSVTLDYLERMGVDPAIAVKILVASHWHKDHVAGMGGVMEACTSARFVISPALTSEEARLFLAAHARNRVDRRVPIEDMYRALCIAADRATHAGGRRDVVAFAGSNKILWERPTIGSIPAATVSS
jgi:beta-lactamase superfamily II metal-dependent hydrolase